MRNVIRALTLVILCASLTGCAAWQSTWSSGSSSLQAAQLDDDTARKIIPAAFTQTVPISTAALTKAPKLPAISKHHRPLRSPTQRVAAANTAALQEPSASGYINANQVYNYSDGALYRLYAAPQEVSDIALQPGEALTAISAGDTTRWVVGDTSSGAGPTKQVHVLAKPYAAGLRTNLVITTDRRSYHLELRSTADTFMAAVSWTYPQDGLVRQLPVSTASASPLDGLPSIENLHFGYSISGDNVAWKPLRAFDDGTRVYIEFPKALEQGDAPPLFVTGPTGSHDLVNYRVRGSYYVVDQLFRQAELRFGTGRQQLVKILRTAPIQTADAGMMAGR